MAKATRLGLFPQEQWFRLIDAVTMEGRTIRVKYSDKVEAFRLRWRFYQLRKLLAKSEAEEHQSLAKRADGVEVIVKAVEGGWEISFVPRDLNSEAKALAKALGD